MIGSYIRIVVGAALLPVLLASCSKTEVRETQPQPLVFGSYSGRPVAGAGSTRADGSFALGQSLPQGASFGVNAWNTASVAFSGGEAEPEFMAGVKVTYNGGEASDGHSYGYTPVRYWPKDEDANLLSFAAWYPYGCSGLTAASWNSYSFAVAESPAEQSDFMLSDICPDMTYSFSREGTVDLRFHHMLTQVRFKGIADAPQGVEITLDGITLRGLYGSGSISVAYNPEDKTTSFGPWEQGGEATASYSVSPTTASLPSSSVDGAEAIDIHTSPEGILLLLPQTLSDDSLLDAEYTIKAGGRTLTQTATLSLNTEEAHIWKPGAQIVYTIRIGLDLIRFDAVVTAEWDEGLYVNPNL